MFPPDDAEFEDTTVATAESAGEGGWSIQRGDGWSFLVPAHSPVTPAVGMAARFYGKGIGSTVRGLYLDGRCVFYRTAAEQAARHAEQVREMEQEREYDFERRRAGYDQAAAALPSPFRERIDRFRRIGGRAWRGRVRGLRAGHLRGRRRHRGAPARPPVRRRRPDRPVGCLRRAAAGLQRPGARRADRQCARTGYPRPLRQSVRVRRGGSRCSRSPGRNSSLGSTGRCARSSGARNTGAGLPGPSNPACHQTEQAPAPGGPGRAGGEGGGMG
jgi:hypothetical protein